MITTEEIRRWAMALPEVTETSNARFKVPVFHVSGKTFVGMGRNQVETTTPLSSASLRTPPMPPPQRTRRPTNQCDAKTLDIASSGCRCGWLESTGLTRKNS